MTLARARVGPWPAGLFCLFVALLVQPGHLPDPFGLGDAGAWPALCFAAALPILILTRPRRSEWRTWLDPFIAAYLMIVFLTWPTAFDGRRTFLAIAALVANILLFYGVVTLARRHPRLPTIVFVVVVMGAAVLQVIALSFHLELGLLTRPKVYDRPAGWSGYPELGMLGAIQFAVLLAAFQTAGDWKRGVATLILLAVAAVELAFLYARLPWIAAAGVFCVAFVTAARSGDWRPLAGIVLCVALVGGSLIAANVTLRRLALETIGRSAPHIAPEGIALEIATPDMRVAIWTRTLRMIGDHWTLGVGLGNFRSVYEAEYNPDVNDDMRRGGHAHNFWLHQAAELGVPGGLAYTALWAAGLFVGWRGMRSSFVARAAFYTLLGIAIIGLGDNLFAVTGGPGARLHTLAWIAFGLVAARTASGRGTRSTES